jgi:phosphatidylglycerol:prolipoprotein diacylglycerol transferase
VRPTQLYEAVGEGAILLVLLAVWRRRRARGEIGLAYLTLYPLLRLAIEPLRGDSERGMVGGLAGSLSVPQLASLALLAMAALLWWIMGARTTVGRPLSG